MKKLAWGTGLVLLAIGCGDDEKGTEGSTGMLRPDAPPEEKLLVGLGGEATVNALTGLAIEGAGSRWLPHEGVRPSDEPIEANTFERTVSIDLAEDALRVDTQREVQFLFPGEQEYSDIIRENVGASTQQFFGAPLGALSSDKVASIRRQEMLLTPHFLIREIEDSLSADGDEELDGEPHHRLVASGGPAPLTLFVNAETGRLTKIATMEHDFYMRDVPLEIEFGDWEPAGDISFPRELRVIRDGLTVFEEEVSDVTVNPVFEPSQFEFPEGVMPSFDEDLFERGQLSHQWYYLLDSIGLPFSGVDESVTRMDVAEGVVQLVGASHHSFLVEQAAGLVLVDAPLYEDRGRALFEFISNEFDGKPITHVVASHFHEDHVAGIREVLGSTQAALVVHASVEEFWRDVLAKPSTLRPDALHENRREVTILTVPDSGELELPDATRPVTLHHVESTHAGDLLLTHEPSSNSVFVVDIYSPGNMTQIGAGELDAAITTHGIPTENLKIVGGHGAGFDDYATLQSQLP